MKKEIKSMTLDERESLPDSDRLVYLEQRLSDLEGRHFMMDESRSKDNKWLSRVDDRVRLLIAQMEMISKVFGIIQEATLHTETAKRMLLTEGKRQGKGR